MKINLNNKTQKGQAMVETAIVLPLLVLLLLGVGYFGSLITTQHNITVAARQTARLMAIESTRTSLDRTEGTYLMRLTENKIKEYAVKALPFFDQRRIKVEKISIHQALTFTGSLNDSSSFTEIPEGKGYAYLYVRTGKAKSNSTNLKGFQVSSLNNMDVGIGAIFYGVKLTYRLKEIDWMARYLFRNKEGITLQAISMMPAELPLRGGLINYGLIDINSGIFKIITEDPTTKIAKDYVDLVE